MEKNEQTPNYPGVCAWGGYTAHRPPHVLILRFNLPSKKWAWCQSEKLIYTSDIVFDIKSGYPVPYAPDMMNKIDWSQIKIASIDFELAFEYDWRASSANRVES